MTLNEAIKFLLNEFFLEDQVYHAREMGRSIKVDGEYWYGSSWDHPFVTKFAEAVATLRKESK